VYALPAAVVALADPSAGVPLAVGVLPAVMVPIPGPRRSRIVIVVIGAIAGLSMFVGGLLAHLPTAIAAVLLAGAVTGAAVLSAIRARGRLILTLCVPLVAAGLSYDDLATSAGTLLLLVTGSIYAWLASLAWPQRPASRGPDTVVLPARRAMLDYGIRLGIAAALGYLIADAAGLDHPGWASAACLLVARPQLDLLQTRGVGRVLAVLAGATAAALVLRIHPPHVVYALLAMVVLAAAAATGASRWYVTPGFATFFVFILLVYDHPAQSAQKFTERVGETILGVALAYIFSWVIPYLGRRRTSAESTHSTPT
jgi:hypothetical protein